MVCPYCQIRNIPNAAVCSHCGVILKFAQHQDKVAPRRKIKKATLITIALVGTASLVGGAVGWFAGGWFFPHIKYHFIGAVIGAAGAGALMFLVSGARVIYQTNYYKTQMNALHSRIRNALSNAEEKYEKQLDDKDNIAVARLHLAIAHLLNDEVEKSIQEFEQAQRHGVKESIFYNNAGVALARRGSLNLSVEMFQKASSQNGHKGEPHINLAHAYARAVAEEEQLLIERALEEIRESIKYDGDKPSHRNRMGTIYTRAGKYDMAMDQFRQAIDLAVRKEKSKDLDTKRIQADGHNNIGVALFYKGDIKGASTEFQTAIKLDQGHGRALSNYGVILLSEGDDTEALDALQNAARLDTRSAPVHNNLGYALCRSKTINEGLREFREAVLNDPAFFEPYYNIGKAYLDADILDAAERNLSRALALNNKSWEIYHAIGVMRMYQSQLKQAVQSFTAADKLAPNQPLIMLHIATCAALDGDLQYAQEVLEKASEIDHNNPNIHAQLGWVYLLQENIVMASNSMITALSITPNNAMYHNNYGLCQLGRPDLDNALVSFRKANALGPDHVKVHYHIGYVYARQNKMDMAIKEWEQSTKLEPKFVDCQVNLGVAYYHMGQYEKAVNEFKKVIAARQNRMEDFSNLGLALAKHGVTIRSGAKNREDPRWKDSVEKHKLAVDMFDRALQLEPNNVMLHSNRGLACFFANRAEDAVMEWAAVSKLDPSYARRREKTMQSEFDESAIAFATLNILERADRVQPQTADFLYRISYGYDTEEWRLIIDDEEIANIPNWTARTQHIERTLKSLKI